jgi:hypothetical protein
VKLLDTLEKTHIREFFSKGWMTHDAMWYYHCLQELGADQANRINRAAIFSMAGIEIQRIRKLMGRNNGPVGTCRELREILDTAFELVLPEFMKFHYSFPEEDLLRGGFHECFAFEGVKKYGAECVYQCGIVTRIKGWLEALGVKYVMVPDIKGCLMRDQGKCEVEFHFGLE